MIPKIDKNKETLLCPVCDGEGTITSTNTRDDLTETISEPCSECNGTGYLPIIKTK
jgi:DnaJ-class molecular chaperone